MSDVTVVFLLIGIIFLIGATFLLASYSIERVNKRLISEDHTVYAKVMGNSKEIAGAGDIISLTYTPVLEYEINGVTFTAKGRFGYPTPKYSEGKLLKIYYDKKRPELFLIDGEQKIDMMSGKVIGWLIIVAGVIMSAWIFFAMKMT